jgi:hypothetical protein
MAIKTIKLRKRGCHYFMKSVTLGWEKAHSIKVLNADTRARVCVCVCARACRYSKQTRVTMKPVKV